MSSWQHSCEYTPRFLSLRLLESYKWWQLRWMKVLHCHPNSSKTWYRVHTTFNDPLRIIQHRHGMSPWQHLCEYTPRFLSLRVLDSYKWWQLRWMKVLQCHPNSSKTWYRVHTTFNDPLRKIHNHHGMSPWQHLCEYTPRFLSLRVLDSYMVAVEVDESPPMPSQLLKDLI